jgi:alanine-glyoxylate transaminase/serine-glyoxylate transaminase/serine-pyruvate transaminase
MTLPSGPVMVHGIGVEVPFVSELLERHGIEIGAGAGAYATSVWRIGLMGRNARPDAVLLVLAALEDVLGR